MDTRATAVAAARQGLIRLGPNGSGEEGSAAGAAPTFESFLPAPSNQLALRALREMAEGGAREPETLLLVAPPGCGKTHLLRALHGALLAARIPVLYLPADRFHRQFVYAIQRRLLEPFRRKYRAGGVLILDDVQRLATQPRTQVEFLHTFDAVLQRGGRVVLSSDRPAGAIEGLCGALRDRLRAAVAVRMDRPDAAARLAFLRARARAAGYTAADAWLARLAAQDEASPADLLRALERLEAGGGDPAEACRLLDALRRGGAAAVTVEAIARRVGETFGVREEDLRGGRRTRALVDARRLCFHLGRRLTPLTLEALGRAFGGRDHATVLQAIRHVEMRRAADAAFDRQIAGMEEALRRGGGEEERKPGHPTG